MDRLRQALTGHAPDAHAWLPPGPWRVVALTSADPAARAADVGRRLDLWEAVLRRQSWREPRLVDVADQAFVLVRDDSAGSPTQKSPAGSWTWLRRVLTAMADDGSALLAGAGSTARSPADLPGSLLQAQEVARALEAGHLDGPARTADEAWAALTLARAAQSVADGAMDTPVTALHRHDHEEGTAFTSTLTAWLDHQGFAGEAARSLGVHPNTLRYRMARVQEFLGVDLDDPGVRLALRLQLLALNDANRL